MNPDLRFDAPRRRHARHLGWTTGLGILSGILFSPVAPAWLFVRTLMCGGRLGSSGVCHNGFAGPLLLGATVGLASLAVLALMMSFGGQLVELNLVPPPPDGTFARRAHAVRHGFREMEPAHQTRVRWTHRAVWLTLASVISFWTWFYADVEPPVAWGLAIAGLVMGAVLDRRFFGPSEASPTTTPTAPAAQISS